MNWIVDRPTFMIEGSWPEHADSSEMGMTVDVRRFNAGIGTRWN